MGKYTKLATEIVALIGGKENVKSLSHCITRLRFVLKDASIVDEDALKNLDGVVTLMKSGGQHQVVIGNHVADVYADVIEVLGISEDVNSSEDEKIDGLFNKFIDLMSKVFQPILSVLAASGLIKGFSALLAFLIPAYATSSTAIVINAIGDGLFKFLPIIIAYTAGKKFKMNVMVAMVIGAILMYPTIQSTAFAKLPVIGNVPVVGDYKTTFLGIPFITQDYAGSIIPSIVIVAFASMIEKRVKKFIPQIVQSFLVPFFTLLISLIFGLLVIGPIISVFTNLLMYFFESMIGISPILFGALLGLFWQVLVIFGLHWSVIPLGLIAFQAQGFDRIMVGYFGASFAQTAVVLAMALKIKNRERKALAVPAIISGIFGVTEPCIYGFSLPAKKPFIYSMIGGCISGGLLMLLGGTRHNMGALGVFGIINYIDKNNVSSSLFAVILCIVVASLIGFVLTMLFWKDEEAFNSQDVVNERVSLANRKEVIKAPIKGEIIPLSEIKDEAFANGAIGKGLAIKPLDGKVYAPVNGVITTLFHTKHAIGITSDEGVEILIHFGMDTVNLNGEGFIASVNQGDKVKAGDLLLSVDLSVIKKANLETDTPVVILNHHDLLDIMLTDKKLVDVNDDLMTVIF